MWENGGEFSGTSENRWGFVGILWGSGVEEVEAAGNENPLGGRRESGGIWGPFGQLVGIRGFPAGAGGNCENSLGKRRTGGVKWEPCGEALGMRRELGPMREIGGGFSGPKWDSVGICGNPVRKRWESDGEWESYGEAAGDWIPVGGSVGGGVGGFAALQRGSVDICVNHAGMRREMGILSGSGGEAVGKRWAMGSMRGIGGEFAGFQRGSVGIRGNPAGARR